MNTMPRRWIILRFSTEAYQESNRTVLALSRLSLLARISISRKCSFLVLPSVSGGVDTEVNREEVACLPAGVQQVDHPDAAYQPAFGSTVLKFDQLDLLRILLVLDAVIDNEIAGRTVVEQGLYDLPQTTGRELLPAQVVAYAIVTGGVIPVEMIGKVSASIVARGK